MLDKKRILMGYSGHGFVVADTAMDAGITLTFYAEFKEQQVNPYDLVYLGFEGAEDFKGWSDDFEFVLGVGDNLIREKIAHRIASKDKKIITLIHPTAAVSTKATFGYGNYIGKNVAVNAFAKIGNGCILNTGSIIEHECRIADFVHIAPGAVLAGNVMVGKGSFIGANAVIKQGVTIGENVVIGAGSVVLKDLENNLIVAGNPAKKL